MEGAKVVKIILMLILIKENVLSMSVKIKLKFCWKMEGARVVRNILDLMGWGESA